MLRTTVALAFLACVSCRSGRSPTPRGTTVAKPTAAATAAPRPEQKPVFIHGPSGGAPIAAYVAAQLAEARSKHRGVLVYVGATWCEPCQQFHHAVEKGELDELLTGVNILEFDLDADRDALAKDGYSSELIPLFVSPENDGKASPRRIEGSIKVPSAVGQNLAPRLRAFLDSVRR